MELRESMESEPDWEDDHEAAKRRILELEAELDSARLVVQDYADRALPETQLSGMVAESSAALADLRRKLKDELRRRRRLERTNRTLSKMLRRLESRNE